MPKWGGKGQKVAVVGGGVAGIVAAHLLQHRHDVYLFEQNDYLGGHTHTIDIADGPDKGLAVDTGFIVLNDKTYPRFEAFLEQLGVATRPSEMSFGFTCRQSGLVYAGTDLNGLFADRRNLCRPDFFRFLLEIVRFCSAARRDLAQNRVPAVTLRDYLARGRYARRMIDNYLVPMAAAIWSTPSRQVVDFPAEPFLRFFANHGLLAFRHRPQWKTVVGGSHAYVKAFARNFKGKLHLATPVRRVRREADRVELELDSSEPLFFEQVVIAAHADQALRLLADPSDLEERLLSPWRYQKNHVVLHTDAGLLPSQRRARAAWNFARETDADLFVTYYMNRLQGLDAERDYCVTLNRQTPYRPETVIAEMDYHHPLYTFDSLATQAKLPALNGRQRTWFCGSYFGFGFHEDAVRSAWSVADCLGEAP